MKIFTKALYAIALSIILFPRHSLIGRVVFAGGLFIISLFPATKAERQALPKKVSIALSTLLITIVTLLTGKAIYEQTNVPIVLLAYVILVMIVGWDIRKDLKPKP
jgi:hypothetical protein